ncbi:MAG: magnesium transporter [Acidimicrobiales bacterium]
MRSRLPAVWHVLGADTTAVAQSLSALTISSVTAVGAGLALSAMTGTLAEIPGLLVLVPAAIGMRGNIFGALGSRLATAIHTGSFAISRRVDTVVGQNVVGALLLSGSIAIVLAGLARVAAAAFGLASAPVADLVVVSFVGASLSSLVVLVFTLALASASVSRNWDLDNVNAPLVSAVGDVVTLPALFVGAQLVGIELFTPGFAVVALVASAAAFVLVVRSQLALLAEIVRESLPVLVLAGVLVTIAGVAIEHRFEAFEEQPALLILVPAALSGAGAIGGILASQLSSKLHLGVIDTARFPQPAARRDIAVAGAIAVPVFVLNGVLAEVASILGNRPGPGLVDMVAISLTGGLLATCAVVIIAYYGAVAAVRFGVDPDTYGIPIVTSVVDLVGAWALVFAIATWGAG